MEEEDKDDDDDGDGDGDGDEEEEEEKEEINHIQKLKNSTFCWGNVRKSFKYFIISVISKHIK